MPEFHGFPLKAMTFFERLAADNSKAFWTDHRTEYDDHIRDPMRALSDAVCDEFGPLHLFRPNRDVRFSKDKTPYKTHCGAVTEGEGGESFYVQIAADGLFVGAGYYHLWPDQLTRYREAVAADTGEDLETAIGKVRAAGLTIGGEALKSAPRGYAKDHPRIALLRHKGIYAHRSFGSPKWIGTPEALERITNAWRAAAPLNGWLNRHVGPTTMPPDAA
ncbi:MAG TPA: DUF2461 domain-containing protein [Acidimicrobiales bacterium]|jgi:uncharacterized protein (TIGR02453 family)|nr:DUF2461 domain-containing protein [Acidimicrobiales bacterium]